MAAKEKATSVRGNRGFTLIELMITVAVIGILSAIAYPSYRESVAKGRRAQAIGILQSGSQWMERFYAENYRYDQNTAAPPVLVGTLFPNNVSQSPPSPEAAMYTMEVSASATAMTITAKRAGSMSSDRCGNFVIDQLGVKKVDSYDTSKFASADAALAYCWK
jgi:type IV pilus assembly protein PilE